MLKVLTLLLTAIASISADCNSNRTCLDVYLHDAFHDGWDGAMAYVETPWGDVLSDAPTCDRDPVHHTLCTDVSGLYPIVVTHEDETYTPKNYWEVKFIS